jgi:hypothetical protein
VTTLIFWILIADVRYKHMVLLVPALEKPASET